MSVIAQTPFLTLFPDASASKCIRRITQKLMARDWGGETRSLEIFWRSCLNFLAENQSTRDHGKIQIPEQGSNENATRELMDLIQGMETKVSALVAEIKAMKRLVTQGLPAKKR
jgi:hypothetical protein